MNFFTSFLGGMPGANGNPASGLFSFIGIIMASVAGKQSIHWVRPNELMVMSTWRGLVQDKKTKTVRVFKPGIYIRLPWVYQSKIVLMSLRNDLVEATRTSLATETERPKKITIRAMARWCVRPVGKDPYLASEWLVPDVGEFARGVMGSALSMAIESMPASQITLASLFEFCRDHARQDLNQHGLEWLGLYVNEIAIADAEVQASAIDRLTAALAA